MLGDLGSDHLCTKRQSRAGNDLSARVFARLCVEKAPGSLAKWGEAGVCQQQAFGRKKEATVVDVREGARREE